MAKVAARSAALARSASLSMAVASTVASAVGLPAAAAAAPPAASTAPSPASVPVSASFGISTATSNPSLAKKPRIPPRRTFWARTIRAAVPPSRWARSSSAARSSPSSSKFTTAHLPHCLDLMEAGGLAEADHRKLRERAAQQPAHRQPQRAGDQQYRQLAALFRGAHQAGHVGDQALRGHRVERDHHALLAGSQRLAELGLDAG